MKRTLQRFQNEDDGAVTADWVVLTAAIVGLGIAAIGIVIGAATPQAENLGQYLQNQTVGL